MTLDLNLGLYLSVNHRPRLAKLLGVQPPSPSFRQREADGKVMQGKKTPEIPPTAGSEHDSCSASWEEAAEQGRPGEPAGELGSSAGEGKRGGGLAGLCLGSSALIPLNRDDVKLCHRSPFRPCRAHPGTGAAPCQRREEEVVGTL